MKKVWKKYFAVALAFPLLAGSLSPAPRCLAPWHKSFKNEAAAELPGKIRQAMELLEVSLNYLEELDRRQDSFPFPELFRNSPAKPSYLVFLSLIQKEGVEKLLDALDYSASWNCPPPRELVLKLPAKINWANLLLLKLSPEFTNSGFIRRWIPEKKRTAAAPFSAVPVFDQISVDVVDFVDWVEKTRPLSQSFYAVQLCLQEAFPTDYYCEDRIAEQAPPVEFAQLKPIGVTEEAFSRFLYFAPSRFFAGKRALFNWMRMLGSGHKPSDFVFIPDPVREKVSLPIWNNKTHQNILRALTRHRHRWFEEMAGFLSGKFVDADGETVNPRKEALQFFLETGWLDPAVAQGSFSPEPLFSRTPILRAGIPPWKRDLFIQLKRHALQHAGEDDPLADYLWGLTFPDFEVILKMIQAQNAQDFYEHLPSLAYFDYACNVLDRLFRERGTENPLETVRMIFEFLFFEQPFDAVHLPRLLEDRIALWRHLDALITLYVFLGGDGDTEPVQDFWNAVSGEMRKSPGQTPKGERKLKSILKPAFQKFEKEGIIVGDQERVRHLSLKTPLAEMHPEFKPISNQVRAWETAERSL